ncbi:uncharacterized protein BYT42DRAFT_646119 [Radiomyces spectabilis]|uniref:uncharacterized protein n=1 Tax=Radiomyces spectabilis TaxID=64574 RepID=UPI00221E5A54|nr:uncharacterized protein BYT42DRAFT_646119 [Radiomyces spectabilis]KAI8376538.1 hypothetical protein BYT42DRAFT_646119 [Radiomyces spectabilis]
MRFYNKKQTQNIKMNNSTWDKAAGDAKNKFGNMTGNDRMAAKGTTQNTTCKIEETLQNAENRASGMADQVRDKFSNLTSGNSTSRNAGDSTQQNL